MRPVNEKQITLNKTPQKIETIAVKGDGHVKLI